MNYDIVSEQKISSSKKFLFYFPFLFIIISIYRDSIIPGGRALINRENYIFFGMAVFYILMVMNFQGFLSLRIKLFRFNNKYLTLLFILLGISIVFYNIQEITKVSYLVRLLDLILFFIVFFFYLPKIIIYLPLFLEKLVLIISHFSLIVSVIGFLMLYGGYDGGYSGMLISFIGHPNYIPAIFNAGIISTFFYIDWKKNKLTQFSFMVFVVSIIIQILACLLTFTRAGYIGLGAGLSLYLMLKFKKKFIALFPFLIIFLAYIIPPFFKAKGFSSFGSRIYLLFPAYAMMIDSKNAFLWGYGNSEVFNAFLKFNSQNITGEYYINNPHNAVASLIITFGILFAAVMIIFITLTLIKFSVKAYKSENKNKNITYAYLVSLPVAYIFLSFFDSSILYPEYFSIHIFLIFLGLLNYLSDPLLSENFFSRFRDR